MAKEEIEIEISPSGKVTARPIGFKGHKCIDLAEMLALIVGKEESRTYTSEYYEVEAETCERVEVHKQNR